MPNPAPHLVADCSTWLSIVSKLFSTRMAVLLDPHGLTHGQFSILNHITRDRQKGGSRISQIAAAVEVEQPAVTKTIAKFHNMGLVTFASSPTDKRAKLVTATPKAGEVLKRIYSDMGPDLTQVFGALDVQDVEHLAKSLKHLGQWLDENRL